MDFEADDDVAGDEGAPGDRGGDGHGPGRKPTRPSRVARAGAAVDENACYLCESDGTDGNRGRLVKTWRNARFHQVCWNAIRAYLRKCESKRSKDVELYQFTNQPGEWRAAISPFIVSPGTPRSPHLSRGVATAVQANVEVYEERRMLLLPKNRYKKYMRQWEGWCSDEASSEFERQVEQQSDPEADGNGHPRVRTPDNDAVVYREVRKSAAQPSSRADSSAASRMLGSQLPRGRSQLSEGGGWGSSSVAGESNFGDFDDDDGQAKRRRCAPSPSRASSVMGVPTPRSDRKGGRREDLGQLALKPAQTMTLVEYMQEKKRLESECNDCLKMFESRTFVRARIAAMWAKLNKEQQEEHKVGHTTTMEQLAHVHEKMNKLKGDLGTMKIADVEDMRTKLANAKAEVDKVSTTAEEFFAGMRFLAEQGTEKQRKVRLHDRYQRSKLATKLHMGGFRKAHAKNFANKFYDAPQECGAALARNIAGSAFDPLQVTVWDGTDDLGKDMMNKVAGFKESFAPALHSKVDSLQRTLDNPKNEKWTGAMAKVDSTEVDFNVLGLAGIEGKSRQRGGEPWVACMKAYSWRWGPNAWPVPGVGSLVVPLGKGTMLQVFKVNSFVQEGLVVLNDVPGFLDTQSGGKMLDSVDCSWMLLDLRESEGAVIWIPYGWVVAPVYVPPKLPEEGALPDPTDLSFVWTMAIFSKEMAGAAPAAAMAAIVAFNRVHFDRMSNSPLWQTRKEAFDAIVE